MMTGLTAICDLICKSLKTILHERCTLAKRIIQFVPSQLCSRKEHEDGVGRNEY